MKYSFIGIFLILSILSFSQSPVGKWKMISHVSEFQGEKMDSHAALLKMRPCAANMVYEINPDQTYRLNAKESGCDEKYITMQEKLYSKTNWKQEGDVFTTSSDKSFAVGQSYKMKIEGNKLILTGIAGQGTQIFQKL
jgi:hypothetical protein